MSAFINAAKNKESTLTYPCKFHKTFILGGIARVLIAESLEEVTDGSNNSRRGGHEHGRRESFCGWWWDTGAATAATTTTTVGEINIIWALLLLLLIHFILIDPLFRFSAAFGFFQAGVFRCFINNRITLTLILVLSGKIFEIITSFIRLKIRVEILYTGNVATMEVSHNVTKHI